MFMIKLKCPACNKIFFRRKGNTHLTPCQKGTWTSCSNVCKGRFSRKMQLEGKTSKYEKSVAENVLFIPQPKEIKIYTKPDEYDKTIKTAIDKTLGYVYFCDKEHPLVNKSGKIYYHRHVASIAVNRWVRQEEDVHHKDENKLNNSPENLEILTREQHTKLHSKERYIEKKVVKCITCKNETTNKKFCSSECFNRSTRRVVRPTKEELKGLINTTPFTTIGKMYGVSDNAIRKWARIYKII